MMTIRKGALAAVTVAATAILAGAPASASVVATIQGAYDYSNYDTPELDFMNTSGGSFINAQMVLTGYQPGTLNYGATQTVALPNMSNGATTAIIWGSIPGANGATSAGNLTAYDYDDEWGNTPGGYTNPNCVVGGGLCSLVGNFSVVFTATISGGPDNGKSVYSVFSPTSNYTGGFVGWEGLDPTGLSETVYDQHSGVLSGTMAIVQIGTPPVPEASTWAMMALGFAGLGFAGYRSRRSASAIA